MSEHTPGRIIYEIVPSDKRERSQPHTEWTGLFIGLDDEEGGMSHTLFEGGFTHGPKDGEPEADAQRLIACWNACAGIPTEQLEAGCVEKLLSAVDGINSFAWSSMTADCNEARDEANNRLANLREAAAPFQKDSD